MRFCFFSISATNYDDGTKTPSTINKKPLPKDVKKKEETARRKEEGEAASAAAGISE